jgi:hypothetical protein
VKQQTLSKQNDLHGCERINPGRILENILGEI